MRRVLVVLAAAALLVALPSVASAHPSVRESDSHLFVMCDPVQTDDGTMAFYAAVSNQYGSDAGLAFWQGSAVPEMDFPTWSSFQSTVQLSSDDMHLTATLDLYEFVPEPEVEGFVAAALPPPDPDLFVGQATVELALSPAGDPQPYASQSSGTNTRYRVEGVVQEYSASGAASLPGDLAFDLESCTASRDTYTFFGTNPDAFVGRFEGAFVSCHWEGDGYSIGLSAYREAEWASADMFITDLEGDYFGMADVISMTDASLFAELSVYASAEPGEEEAVAYAVGPVGEVVGSATVSASLEPTGDRQRSAQTFGWEKFRSQVEALTVSGEMTVAWPGGEVTLVMDAESCGGETYTAWQQSATPNGKPRAKPVANDLPENALAIAPGESDSLRDTSGTSPDPEAPCTMIDPELGEPVELPFGHTAWWSVVGTGGEVTVDTAGSSFDTVLAVYAADGDGGLTQLGCVDDVFDGEVGSLQASITFETDAGATYLVQAGGYGGSTGRLELAVR
jgi:hypothetical protein